MTASLNSNSTKLEDYVNRWIHGDNQALHEIFEIFYSRNFLPNAKNLLRQESKLKLILPPEGLISLTFEKMDHTPPREFLGEKSFWNWVSSNMRQALKDESRRCLAEKRGKNARIISLTQLQESKGVFF